MKLIGLKILMLALYVTTVTAVSLNSHVIGGFWLLAVTFILGYCGIIVLSQLIAALVSFCHWCVAENRERGGELFAATSVDFETESEAT